MQGSVVRITRDRSCEVRLPNDILVVFAEPAGHQLHLSDVVSFSNFRLDADVCATNQTRGVTFTVRIQSNNVHDLRMTAFHGGCRTPSADRLLAK